MPLQGCRPPKGQVIKKTTESCSWSRRSTNKAYQINVAPYHSDVSYGNGWTHIDGWSERVLDYIALMQRESVAHLAKSATDAGCNCFCVSCLRMKSVEGRSQRGVKNPLTA